MRAYLLPLACVLVLAGCDRQKNEHTVTISGSNGATVTMSGNNEHFTVKDANGNATVDVNSSGGAAPSNLPAYVSVYPGAKVQSSVVGSGTTGTGGSIAIQASASIADVLAFYKKQAASAGFAETMNLQTGGTTMFTAASKDSKKSIQVIASSADGGTHAQITWGGN